MAMASWQLIQPYLDRKRWLHVSVVAGARSCSSLKFDSDADRGAGAGGGRMLLAGTRMSLLLLYLLLAKATLTSFSGATSIPVIQHDLVETITCSPTGN